MPKLLLLLTFSFMLNFLFAQKINYKKFQTSLQVLGCTKKNGCKSESVGIKSDNAAFCKLKLEQIKSKDLVEYYSDYGFNCFKMFFVTKDSNYIYQSIKLFEAGLKIDSTNSGILWNCAGDYCIINECEKAKLFFNSYLKFTPQKYITSYTHQQIKDFIKDCGTY